MAMAINWFLRNILNLLESKGVGAKKRHAPLRQGGSLARKRLSSHERTAFLLLLYLYCKQYVCRAIFAQYYTIFAHSSNDIRKAIRGISKLDRLIMRTIDQAATRGFFGFCQVDVTPYARALPTLAVVGFLLYTLTLYS